ncbi:olfactory receptor-like protein DTMT [Erpetoichthys calabaricus]|uniref:olfactory receptor-like protein DTMT n=1 Tax=Erpetoichthys calabaricus TaxID=27687 RepID=UPI00109F3E67|nr:olfactory receptor-like protein DTMT [Erpetoichthys calabaricus]
MFNSSLSVAEFVLHCAIRADHRILTVVILLIIYLISIFGNLLVILVIKMNRQLHSAMYIFISTIAVIDLVNTNTIIPRLITILQFNMSLVPYGACLTQMYFILNINLTESLLVTFMALDRYVAVVHPLRYPSIVTKKIVWIAVLSIPVFAFLLHISMMVFVSELSFCRTNVLPYCYCDYSNMVQIACNDDPKYLLLLSTFVILLGFCPMILILFTYARIFSVALKITSLDANSKAFSTCVTHLIVLVLAYIPSLATYILPSAGVKMSTEVYNTLVIVGNVIPPMMNPVIYSFRNKEIKIQIYMIFTGKKTIPGTLQH